MTDDQITLINAANILRVNAAELYVSLDFIGERTIEYAGSETRHEVLDRATMVLLALGSRVRALSDELAPLFRPDSLKRADGTLDFAAGRAKLR